METIVTGRIFINEEYLNEKGLWVFRDKSVRQPSWSLWESCGRVDMALISKYTNTRAVGVWSLRGGRMPYPLLLSRSTGLR